MRGLKWVIYSITSAMSNCIDVQTKKSGLKIKNGRKEWYPHICSSDILNAAKM